MKNKINEKKKETNQKIPKLSNIIKDADKKCIKKAVEKVKKMKTVMTDIEKDNPDLLSVDKYDIDDMENNNLFTERTENIFTDLIYRYTISKKKIDLELQLSNLLNTTNFKTININDFSYVETNFNLRPRQILFKIRFTL